MKLYKVILAIVGVVMLCSCSAIKRETESMEKLSKQKIDPTEQTHKETTKWWKEAVCYEIYIRSFNDSNGDGIGDINGVTEKLDYLKDLGVDVVWITPFYPSPDVDMGYDISDYKNIDPKFGTLEDFNNLVKKAHEKGIKIIVDMVFSHTSDQHKWFKEGRKSKNNPYHDYYFFLPPKDGNKLPNDWMSWFSGPAWEFNKQTDEYYLHVFAVQQPALNWTNPEVREQMHGVAKFWLDQGADGLRFDVITLIAMPPWSESDKLWGAMPKVHDYLKELNRDVLSKYDILTVGEMPGVNYENAWEYVGADKHQLETVFQLDIMSGVDNKDGRKFEPAPMNLLKFKSIYENWYNGLYGKGWNSVVLGNHDQGRIVSRWGNDKKFRKESAKMLSTFLMTQWGTPYIYEGDEIGMTNCPFSESEFKDIEAINYYKTQIKEGRNVADFMPGLLARCRDNSRTPIQWNADKNAGFSTADKTWIKVNPNYKKINVLEEQKDPDSIFNYYKKVIKMKKNNSAFTYGSYEQVDPKNENVYAYTRSDDSNSFLVVLNFKGEPAEVNTSISDISSKKLLIRNYNGTPVIDKKGMVRLRPYEAIVFKVK